MKRINWEGPALLFLLIGFAVAAGLFILARASDNAVIHQGAGILLAAALMLGRNVLAEVQAGLVGMRRANRLRAALPIFWLVVGAVFAFDSTRGLVQAL